MHTLRAAGGPALLLLHGLGERSPKEPPRSVTFWPGGVYALDFTGHGDSEVPAGGGYTAEALMGDADAALAQLGTATVLGRGLGAYVALLLTGARPELLRGTILADGSGLAGGGPSATSPLIVQPPGPSPGSPDPMALIELTRDLRPREYAQACVSRAGARSAVDPPIVVSAVARPPWLSAVVEHPAVRSMRLTDAVATYAHLATGGG
jgi:pimeloyl-ACP methyl ester carboxylesterase